MKKFFLILAAVAMVLPGCKKIEESIDATNARIDKLEQKIPTIDEQISSIQESINALEEVDSKLKESIKALEASDKATAEEIAALKDADKAIEDKIEELKKYIDDVLKSTKDWVNATFATLEQLNALSSEVAALKSLVDANKAEATANLANAISNLETSLKKWVGEQLSNYYTIADIDAKIAELQKAIADGDAALQQQLNELKSQLETTKQEVTEAYKKAIKEAIETNNGVINQKIASEIAAVNKRIDEEVAAISAKIATLQAQVDKNTEDIAKLLARIQSVSYLPEYSDEVATIHYLGDLSEITLDFKVSPKECAAELAKVWQTAVSCEALYTKTRAALLVKMSATAFEVTDAENGVITITASGENLSQEFFAGAQEAKVALVISDGNNSVTSDYIPMIAKEVTNEIWYTSTDGNIVTPYSGERNDFRSIESLFGANLVSNTYKNGVGKLVFDATITLVGEAAFYQIDNLETITLPNGIKQLGGYVFAYTNYLRTIKLPACLEEIYRETFHQCNAITELTLPDSVTKIAAEAFYNCSKLEYIYSKLSTPDNMTVIVDETLRWVSRHYPAGDYKIPEGVKTIGQFAIGYPNNVITVTIPESVDTFANYIFVGANNISAFYGKYTVDNRHVIKDDILYGAAAHGLTEYEIPEGVKGVAYKIFHFCTFTKATLPASLESVSNNLFRNCDKLREVYCKAIVPPAYGADYDIFAGCAKISTIYVPRASVEEYKAATGWSQHADKIVGYDF